MPPVYPDRPRSTARIRGSRASGRVVKAIVVDGTRAYFGSENLSSTSLSKNREVGLIATEPDVLKLMAETFEKDWAAATPL